jgi:hypothetical protein
MGKNEGGDHNYQTADHPLFFILKASLHLLAKLRGNGYNAVLQ